MQQLCAYPECYRVIITKTGFAKCPVNIGLKHPVTPGNFSPDNREKEVVIIRAGRFKPLHRLHISLINTVFSKNKRQAKKPAFYSWCVNGVSIFFAMCRLSGKVSIQLSLMHLPAYVCRRATVCRKFYFFHFSLRSKLEKRFELLY
jgi:hypothetical protein